MLCSMGKQQTGVQMTTIRFHADTTGTIRPRNKDYTVPIAAGISWELLSEDPDGMTIRSNAFGNTYRLSNKQLETAQGATKSTGL
jgi:hypothetical protein